MKALKKVLALCLAAILLLALSPAAFADGETATVTIENAAIYETYNFYQLFSVNSVVTTEDNKTLISYDVNPSWKNFFETGAGGGYIKLDNGNPTWQGEETGERVKAFADAAFAYAKSTPVAPTKSQTFTGSEDGSDAGKTGTLTVAGLPLGYYLVDTSLGALLNLESAHKSVTIQEKNSVPTFKKEVEVTPGNWGSSNTAKIGDTVKFKSEFTIGKGNDYDYFFKDTMSDGLTLDNSTITVQVQPKNGTLSGVTKSETTYTDLTKGEADTFTFGLKFAQAFIEQYREGTVVITYSAVLNEKANIDTSNPNDATLTYNDKTLKGHTDTYTYQFDLVKYYTDANGSKKLLKNAEFKLFENADGTGDAIKFVKNEAGTEYRVAKQGETGTVDTIVTLETEKINIKGLDKKTYYLEETKAPGGYNKLKERVTVDLTGGSKTAATEGTFFTGGVQVLNKSGTTLPSTGGVGTTLFYVVGGLLMVCAVVLLVTKKRMEKNA